MNDLSIALDIHTNYRTFVGDVHDGQMTGRAVVEQADEMIDRRSGIALWRQIADRIRHGIASGELGGEGRLPPELLLSQRFGVNRHTIRAAIAALTQEGVLRAEQGRGTFVEKSRRLSYPIGPRTRFTEALAGQTRERRAVLLKSRHEPARHDIAAALGLEDGALLIRLETLSEADGRPVSRSTSWFPAERFPEIAEAFRQSGSITRALKAAGVVDYLRKSTTISARHAEGGDLEDLGLAPGAIVLAAEAVNIDSEGRPIQFAVTRFAADRIELVVGD